MAATLHNRKRKYMYVNFIHSWRGDQMAQQQAARALVLVVSRPVHDFTRRVRVVIPRRSDDKKQTQLLSKHPHINLHIQSNPGIGNRATRNPLPALDVTRVTRCTAISAQRHAGLPLRAAAQTQNRANSSWHTHTHQASTPPQHSQDLCL